MSKRLIIILIGVAIIAGGVFTILQRENKSEAEAQTVNYTKCYEKCVEGGQYCFATVACASGWTALEDWCEFSDFNSYGEYFYNKCIRCCAP